MAPTGDRSLEKFYFISEILPDKTKTGGEIVLYRHFVERHNYDYTIVPIPRKISPTFQRLEHSRWRSYIKAFRGWYEQFDLSALKDLPKPSFVVTVAHGRECFAAVRAAEYWKVPLVTIFHDWFPASSGVHPLLQFLPDREFRKLYNRSALALCVSLQMMKALGNHPNAIVLPPIPSSTVSESSPSERKSVPNIFYSGFCGGAYFQMLKNCMSVVEQAQAHLTITGMEAQGLATSTAHVSVLGFLDNEAFKTAFKDADILIVLLNFDKRNRKHFSTHFPSKLVEYCGKGKLIGILGPEYSTSIHWARATGAAFYYSEDNPAEFVRQLLEVYGKREVREQYITNAMKVFQAEFAPERIHEKLVSKIAILPGKA